MAGAEGVAPSLPVLETGVLLLNYAPIIDVGQSNIFSTYRAVVQWWASHMSRVRYSVPLAGEKRLELHGSPLVYYFGNMEKIQ